MFQTFGYNAMPEEKVWLSESLFRFVLFSLPSTSALQTSSSSREGFSTLHHAAVLVDTPSFVEPSLEAPSSFSTSKSDATATTPCRQLLCANAEGWSPLSPF